VVVGVLVVVVGGWCRMVVVVEDWRLGFNNVTETALVGGDTVATPCADGLSH
jgi:hypothetical protein